jgi:hypothetical protein
MTLPKCSKKRYRDKEEAVAAMHYRLSPPRIGQPDESAEYLRVYPCQYCFGWHMTSQRPNYTRVAGYA